MDGPTGAVLASSMCNEESLVECGASRMQRYPRNVSWLLAAIFATGFTRPDAAHAQPAISCAGRPAVSLPSVQRRDSAAAIVGTVYHSDGCFQVSGLVFVARTMTASSAQSAARVLLDSLGRFRIDSLTPGYWWLVLRGVGLLEQRHQVYLRPGRVDTLQLIIRPNMFPLPPLRPNDARPPYRK